MAKFLVGRDGPARAMQTALTVANFYPVNTDTFTYWHRVAATIRTTMPEDAPGPPGSEATSGKASGH